jgi:hypothetical protein
MFLMSFIDLQYESIFPINIDREGEIEDFTRFSSRFFLLCNSCFWYASFLRHPSIFSKSPQCSKGEIDCMPIGQNESYNFNYSPKKGVELYFWTQNGTILKE